jgi:lipoate-protein ligase A
MTLLDITLGTPGENLALDHALFDLCEQDGTSSFLRFWQATSTFVVLGYSNSAASEANIRVCEQHGIPVLRRISGGGTIVQTSGCLSYSVVLPISRDPSLRSVPSTNRYMMDRVKHAVSRLIPGATVTINGETDLVVNDRKVAGNAQRRGLTAALFHGVFLLDADLDAITKLLPMPTTYPAYREHRPHGDFIANLTVPASALQNELAAEWKAETIPFEIPSERIHDLQRRLYSRSEWNLRK